MCQFFKKRGYPDSTVPTGKHRAQEIDRETALQTSQNEETERIPFTHTYHPQNLAVNDVILKNFKILRNDPGAKHVFPAPPLISFKHDKNIDSFLVRSAFKSDNQPETFKCTRTRRKTCPFISNKVKISGPNRSAKITDHYPCISVNVIFCITCTICKKIYVRRTMEKIGRPLSRTPTRCRKKRHRCVKTSCAPFQTNRSHHSMIICGFLLHHGNAEGCKTLKCHHQFIFPLGTL